MWELRNNGSVCERALDLVIILIAFFWSVEILFREVWGAQLIIVEQ
jgi:hypothetical protein